MGRLSTTQCTYLPNFKAPRAQEMSRSVALPGFPRIQQVGSDE